MTSSTSGEISRAQIVNLETNEIVECMFNPKEYTFSRTNSWNVQKVTGQDAPVVEFAGSAAGTITMDLHFDTFEAHEWMRGQRAGEDVRRYTKGIWDMMKISASTRDSTTNKGRPPACKFQWGSLWSFEAVITSITQHFTLFLSNGTPVRAKLTVTFQQIKAEGQYPGQNPSSGGNPGHRMRVICEGDTLAGIAYEEYGNPAIWRHLAETNNIDDPRHLRPGQTLLITPLPPR